MSQTQQRLNKGDHVYSAHSLRLMGNILAVFIGKWELQEDGEQRKLFKYPADVEIDGGELMCVMRLSKPIPVDEYRDIHREGLHPIVKGAADEIELILMTGDLACTLPDSM